MPTIEERLAALEKRMAAWIDQQPTTYYTHQYSGEEIDAAVGRALTGGALDTSVTNIGNQLGTFVRPNLLDNWYFGRPVDQRGGMVVLQGTTVYRDVELTITQGTVNEVAMPAYKVTSQAYSFVGADGVTYYVRAEDVVRGYTGNGYSVDRWFFDTDSGSSALTLTAEGLKFIATASATGIASLKQDIDPTMLSVFAGKTVTLSILGKTDISQQVLFYVNSKVAAAKASPAVNGVCMTTLTYTFPAVLENAAIFVYGRSYSGAGEGTILAAKLELGPTQTLAHREGDRWVLNEIPDYGEQLRRCLRYCRVDDFTDSYTVAAFGVAVSDTYWRGLLPSYSDMRTKPTIAIIGDNPSVQLIGNGQSINIAGLVPTVISAKTTGTAIGFNGVSGLVANQTYALQLYRCKIIRSADL